MHQREENRKGNEKAAQTGGGQMGVFSAKPGGEKNPSESIKVIGELHERDRHIINNSSWWG